MTSADQTQHWDSGIPDELEVSDWRFISVAAQKHPTKDGNNCWFKKDQFSDWQRIENADDFWTFFEPLLGTRRANGSRAPASPQAIEPKLRKRLATKILVGVVLLAIASVGGIYRDVFIKSARDLMTPASSSQFSADIEEGLAKAVVGMRAELPKRIDATTTLMWVSYSGTKMIFDNRLEIEGSKVDDGAKRKLGQLITVNTCASPASRKLLDLGGSYRYVYSDIHAKIVTTVEISKEQCS